MDCFNCGNCKDSNQVTYYCLSKQEFIINSEYQPKEKSRIGWKKGNKTYEVHRRKYKKEVEA